MRRDQIKEFNYDSLQKQYSGQGLMAKKMKKVVSKIGSGDLLLDIGCGTGELLDRVKDKFKLVYGMDGNVDAIPFCSKRFLNYENVRVIKCDVAELNKKFKGIEFDYVTALDVLEHLEQDIARKCLEDIYILLKQGGRFIFTAPNWYDKIGIKVGKSKLHKYSHSSYGWAKMIEKSGLKVISIETVDFPLLRDYDFLTKRFTCLRYMSFNSS
jgi:predicted TPR repeat methyltransferase